MQCLAMRCGYSPIRRLTWYLSSRGLKKILRCVIAEKKEISETIRWTSARESLGNIFPGGYGAKLTVGERDDLVGVHIGRSGGGDRRVGSGFVPRRNLQRLLLFPYLFR